MITQACRNCEKWETKDIIYSIGTVFGEKLKLLWMVYGDCYAASSEVYERVSNKISEGVNELPGVEFSDTNELGRVNKVDPLGITYLRIRGMWGIDHPNKVFNYVVKYDGSRRFSFFALMRTAKYNSFLRIDREAIEAIKNKSLLISDVEIKDPDNPAKFIPAKLIQFSMG
jgi:chloramphenicol O-acetyltransferase